MKSFEETSGTCEYCGKVYVYRRAYYSHTTEHELGKIGGGGQR